MQRQIATITVWLVSLNLLSADIYVPFRVDYS